MADALLSPAVGGAMWVATAGVAAYSARKIRNDMDEHRVPLMGVLGAFIFAAQMINFTIPGTGSSGHIGGGMILAVLLGSHAAFLVMASILTVQALFFADGGLLALGANIFNLGFFPCFLAYPILYRPLAGRSPSPGRITAGSVLAVVAGLQLGSLGVVLQTVLSGVSELPFLSFLLVMQPIHLAIGIVEGLVTAAVVTFVWRAQPDILAATAQAPRASMTKVLAGLGAAAFLCGGILSWYASTNPDGLEWSIARFTGSGEVSVRNSQVHASLEQMQEKTSLLPDYGFKTESGAALPENSAEAGAAADAGTSFAGLVGGGLTLLLVLVGVWLLKRRNTPAC